MSSPRRTRSQRGEGHRARCVKLQGSPSARVCGRRYGSSTSPAAGVGGWERRGLRASGVEDHDPEAGAQLRGVMACTLARTRGPASRARAGARWRLAMGTRLRAREEWEHWCCWDVVDSSPAPPGYAQRSSGTRSYWWSCSALLCRGSEPERSQREARGARCGG